MSFQTIKALFVFRTQFKIFWMKNREACDCPIDCQVNYTVKAQKSMKGIVRIVHLPSVVQPVLYEATTDENTLFERIRCFSCLRVEATPIMWYLAPVMRILPGEPRQKCSWMWAAQSPMCVCVCVGKQRINIEASTSKSTKYNFKLNLAYIQYRTEVSTLNANMYCDILKQSMIPSLQKLGRRAVFQHDNDPKHISKKITLPCQACLQA